MVVKTGSALHIPKETFNIATKKGFKVYIPPTQRRWAPTPDVRMFDPNVGGFYFVWWFYCRNDHLLPDIYYRNDYCRIPGRLDRPGISRLLRFGGGLLLHPLDTVKHRLAAFIDRDFLPTFDSDD